MLKLVLLTRNNEWCSICYFIPKIKVKLKILIDCFFFTSKKDLEAFLFKEIDNTGYNDFGLARYANQIEITCDYHEEDDLLIITEKNFIELVNSWKQVLKDEPAYLVVTQDNNGWVKIQGKEALDKDDLQEIEKDKQEHEKLRKN